MSLNIQYLRRDPLIEKLKDTLRRRFRTDLLDKLDDLAKREKAMLKLEVDLRDSFSKQKKLKIEIKKVSKEDKPKYIKQLKEVGQFLAEKTKFRDQENEYIKTELAKFPNIIESNVPLSNTEEDNKVVFTHNTEDEYLNKYTHYELLEKINGVNLTKGVEVAGHRGYYLIGNGYMLNRALLNYATDFLLDRKFTPVDPPLFMKKEIMAKTAELKDFNETLYKIPGKTESTNGVPNDDFLIATAEQPLTALHMDEKIEKKHLPKKYVGISKCFRKEAGSHGKDVRGIFRVHQFDKVEQFVLSNPEDSDKHHQELLENCKIFYESLGIPFRIVEIVSGALNDAAYKKYDLEGKFPSQGYRELVSASNCTDYQSYTLNIRNSEKEYVHLINSTLCASGRTLSIILELYQKEDGIEVPQVLRKYMNNVEFIPFVL